MMKYIFTFLIIFSSIHGDSISCMRKIPKKIWQTYVTKKLPYPAKNAQATWRLNFTYKYALWDDNDIEDYILQTWDQSTYDFFKALPLGVMKADLWRYLIIATEGGIYSDIDSICCKPIETWGIPVSNEIQDILLLGLEDDIHFCQWTIAATSRHPAMLHVARFVVEHWLAHGIDIHYEHFVHATTGPGIWTAALRNYLGVEGMQVGDINQRYINDLEFKNRINDLGVWIFPNSFYGGDASRNLYGSTTFKDGYKSWIKEKEDLIRQSEICEKFIAFKFCEQ